jgi:hypothetical protein
MDEDLKEYISTVKNDAEIRDGQMCEIIDNLIALHDQTFDTGINSYGMDIVTLLLSYLERVTYIDKIRMSYETYERFSGFLQIQPQKESAYLQNAEAEFENDHHGAKAIESVLITVANTIQDPTFRVYLILFTIGIFKDEGTITKKQRAFLDNIFADIKI